MNSTADLYKNFNTQIIQPKILEQKTTENNKNFNKKLLAIPPIIGVLGGGIASSIYRKDVFQKAKDDKENFRSGLELGYKTNSICV